MKILHLVGLQRDQGGVLSLIRNLQEAGSGDEIRHVVWVHDAFEEARTPALNYRYSRYALSEGGLAPGFLLKVLPAFLDVQKTLREEDFDVIHVHSRFALAVGILLTKLAKRPIVFTNHNYARHARFYRWVSQQKQVSTVLLTPAMAEHYGIEIGPPRVNVIPAFCSDRFFEAPLVERRTRFSAERKLRLAGVGMLVDWKSWSTVCEAIALLEPDERQRLEFSHWGEASAPEYFAQLNEYVRRKGLNSTIRFMGQTDRIGDVLSQSDWLIHPALNEPFGIAVIEALALGLPAVVSESGGPLDIVTPGKTGVFFKPGSATDLAGRIRSILQGEVDVLPPAAIRESVRHFSASAVAVKYLELYMKVVRPVVAAGR